MHPIPPARAAAPCAGADWPCSAAASRSARGRWPAFRHALVIGSIHVAQFGAREAAGGNGRAGLGGLRARPPPILAPLIRLGSLRPFGARGLSPAWPRCRSSVVEHSLGKGEVDSSILSGSTSLSPHPGRAPQLM